MKTLVYDELSKRKKEEIGKWNIYIKMYAWMEFSLLKKSWKEIEKTAAAAGDKVG